MAAKMYQHMNPCFEMMIERLPSLLRKQVTREQLIHLEELIIRALDFDLQSDGPLPFLERYQRVLGIDLESQHQSYFKIGYSARKLLRHMMHKATFLSYRPSQIAATAILVAIDLNKGIEMPKQHSYPSTDSFEQASAEVVGNKFDHMLLSEELPGPNKKAISPPSHSTEPCSPDMSKQLSPGEPSGRSGKALDRAWTRQTSIYTQVSKTRDILPVLKDLVASLE